MGKLLDYMIAQYIDKKFQGIDPQEVVGLKEDPFSIKKAAEEDLRLKIRREILSELTKDECDKIRREAKNKIEKENTSKKIKGIRDLILQGLFVAFFVGLEVNQLTNLLSLWIKNGLSGTLTAIGIFAAVLTVFVIYWFGSQVFKLVKGDL